MIRGVKNYVKEDQRSAMTNMAEVNGSGESRISLNFSRLSFLNCKSCVYTAMIFLHFILLYSKTFIQLNGGCHWLIPGHVALTKIKCIPIVIHHSVVLRIKFVLSLIMCRLFWFAPVILLLLLK